MKTNIISIVILLLFIFAPFSFAGDPGLLYGKIYTVDDEVLEGFIRWDKNETSWDNILDGSKDLKNLKRDKRYKKYRNDDDDFFDSEEISIFGITIFRNTKHGYNMSFANSAESGVRIGHIKKLYPDGDNEIILELKSGQEVFLEGGSGDIGDDNREILVDTKDDGIIELYWDDIEYIEFEKTPSIETKFGRRLYGLVATRRGEEYSGFICWDMDEAFDTDILDGHEKNRKRKIRFGKIEMIERRSSNSAIVTLKNGKKIRLNGTNDVDSGNRGIVISDHKLGRIVVDWDDFDYVEFQDPPPGIPYNAFDGGKKLRGKVTTEDGESFTGTIIWDADEEYTWELLDGNLDGVDFAIEMGQIKSIERVSRRGSRVMLKDGRQFKLSNSNDIDDDNKGIFIYTGDGEEIIVDWEDFSKIDFTD